jgi:16S rRNA (cytidine1402-2'-O)-methyltransferase
VCGTDRPVALARELTKLHEEVWRGTLAEAAVHLAEHPPLGEFVLVLGGAPEPADVDDDAVDAAVRTALASGLSTRDAATEVATSLGVARRRAYAAATVQRSGERG